MSKQPTSASEHYEKALSSLREVPLARRSGMDRRQHSLLKAFKALDLPMRSALIAEAVDLFIERFSAGYAIDDLVYLVVSSIASERDWETAQVFLDRLTTQVPTGAGHREVAISLLDLADNDLMDSSERDRKLPLGQVALVLLTEFGLLLSHRFLSDDRKDPAVTNVVEYVTTSLLARSNVNNNAMRIALIHYLAKVPGNNQSSEQLKRVIGRFGHSLLDDLFRAYFDGKKRRNAALHFLVHHLDVFFSSSPALAEMALSVLRHYMLTHPTEFPEFISAYCDLIPHQEGRLKRSTYQISMLLVSAIDVGRKDLAEKIADILLRHVSTFRSASHDLFFDQIRLAIEVVEPAGLRNSSAALVAKSFATAATKLKMEDPTSSRVVAIGRARKYRKGQAPTKTTLVQPTPLESMLCLAS